MPRPGSTWPPICRGPDPSGSSPRASGRPVRPARTGERLRPPAGGVVGRTGVRVRAARGAGHRCGCRAPRHQRVHPRPARARPGSSGPCSGCPAASTRRSSRTWSPRPSARSGCSACCMPYRTSSPESRADAEAVVRGLGTASRAGRHQPHGRRLLRGRPGRQPAPTRQLHGPPADGRAVRPLGDVGRARRGDREQDRVADRLHDALRRLGLCVQPDRRPLQEPGPPARGHHRRPGRDPAEGAVGRPVARPDRRDRGRVQLPRARPAALLADRQAPLDRGDGRAGLRPGRRSSGSTGWSPGPSSSGRCRRSPSSDRGRPASTTSTRGAGRAPRAGERSRRDALRGRHADRQPGRHHPPGARGPARGPADRGRGHAAHAPPAGSPRHRDER